MSRPGAPRSSRRHLGLISLCTAASGAVATHVALHAGVGATDELATNGLRILAGAFEAGTVGALADWFAVTAMFRRIPLPIVGRHTDVLVRKRAEFTHGIVDVVQNRWLAPAVVRDRLASFSASGVVVSAMNDPATRARTIAAMRGVLGHASSEVDGPLAAQFVERLLRDQLRSADLGKTCGRWILGVLERRGHAPLWDVLLGTAARSVRDGALEAFVRSTIEGALDSYAATDWRKRMLVKFVTFIGAADPGVLTEKAIEEMSRLLDEARGEPEHPLRVRIDGVIRALALDLASGRGDATRAFADFQRRLAEEPGVRDVVAGALAGARDLLVDELARDDGALTVALDRLVDGVARGLEANEAARASVDAWVRVVLSDLVERHHGVIGDMVRSSLTGLSDRELVQQVREKVGDDLQIIRLNGAVIGALIGALLAVAKISLGE